jgi:electron transfer flavoprotein alpha/beta subunit
MSNEKHEFWSFAERISFEEAKRMGEEQGVMGVGIDTEMRTVVLSVGGEMTDLSIEQAMAMAFGLQMSAEALQSYISETN